MIRAIIANRTTQLCAAIIFLLTAHTTARANNVAAGELTYTWLRDSTYAIKFTYFNDCKGNAAPANVTLCVNNTCNNTSFTRSMAKYSGNIRNNTAPNGAEIALGCTPHAATICTDPNSKLPGFSEWWYTDTVTLSGKCINWKFSISLSARAINNVTDTGNFYTEAVLNNSLSYQQSSAQSGIPSIFFTCHNQPTKYNLSLSDSDGDSIHITTVNPQTTASIICPSRPLNTGIQWMSPFFDLLVNPISTYNTYKLDGTNGDISFTPFANEGANVLSYRIDEYRNGVKIGSRIKDMLVYVFKCSDMAPQIDIQRYFFDTDTITGALAFGAVTVVACQGQKMDWQFYLADRFKESNFTLRSNITTVLPGSTISFSRQGTDSVRAHVEWTPGPNDTGYTQIELYIFDSTCRPPAINTRFTYTLYFHIPYYVSLGNDTAICAHESINLTPKGGLFSYTWQMLPGSAGTLSCSQCNSPTVKPMPVAEYVVTSSADWCPNVYSDTIMVSTLSTPITYPAMNVVATPGVNVWQWLEVKFTAATANCNTPMYQWMLNNQPIPGANSSTWSSTTLADGDSVYCILSCNDTCPDPRMLSSNILRMNVATSVEQVAQNMPFSLYPNPNNGTFTLQLKDEKPATIAVINTFGQIIHTREVNGSEVISLPHITQGIYTIRLHHNGQTYSTRFTRL